MLVKPDTTTICVRQKTIDGKELLEVNLTPKTAKELDSTIRSLLFFKKELEGNTLEKLDQVDAQIKQEVIMCVNKLLLKLSE